MKNLFYKPDIEEFKIGFEYLEYSESAMIETDTPIPYYKKIFDINTNIKYINSTLNISLIKVKYLDKEDILSLGFKETDKNVFELTIQKDLPVNYCIEFYKKENQTPYLRISQDVLTYYDILFNGYIKNITELKKLLNQIGFQLNTF
jgi:hypothetical protein